MLYLVLRFVHIGAMAAWFAPMLFLPGDVRRAIDGGDLAALRGRLGRYGAVSGGAALLTLLSGIALIFTLGGFTAVPHSIHIGLLLGLVMWAFGAFGVGRAVRELDAAIAAGSSRETLAPFARRIGKSTGIFHLLWVVNLGLMVFRHALG